MPEYADIDRSLGHHVAARGVVALLGLHPFDFSAVATHGDVGAAGDVVWTSHVRDAVEAKLVAAGSDSIAHLHVNVFLRLVSGDECDADDEYRDAEMRDLHAVVAARLCAQLLKRGELSGGHAHAFPKVHDDRGDDPDREQQPETDKPFPLSEYKRQRHRAHETDYKRPPQSRY